MFVSVLFLLRRPGLAVTRALLGWNGMRLAGINLLAFLDARMRSDVVKAGPFDLMGLLAGLEARVRERGAGVIVFGAINVLVSLLDDSAAEFRCG